MEVILAVLRPRQNIGGHDHKSRNGLHEYKPRLYDILLLDSTRDNESRPTKYLPAFPLTNNEEEPRDEVLTNLYQLTGGEKHKGIKGERAILIPWTRKEEKESLSSFNVYCVPVNAQDKLNAMFVEKSPDRPGFYSLENVIDSINNRSTSFPPPTMRFISHLESWLKEKHSRPETLDILFLNRADYRVKLNVSNPAFLPTMHQLSENSERPTAHEALAKMLAIEKCEIVVINPLFNSGLPYKVKADKMVKNLYWGPQDDPSESSRRPSSSTTSSDVFFPSPPSQYGLGFPLHKYATEGNLNGLKNYIHYRSITEKDDRGFAPIHWAAECGNSDAVKFLLEYGCSPNLQNIQHSTPLHIAAEKGHLQVVEVLLSYPDTDVNALDSSGKTAYDRCEPIRDREHKLITNMIKMAVNKMSILTIHIMDGTKKTLKLPFGSDTTVEQLNRQLLRECSMPEVPYGDIFTLWICSESLELQLKPDHKPVEQMEIWKHKILKQLTEGDPDKEEPKLKWRRNAKTGIQDERSVTHPAAIHLLFHEAYKNYISALYPCKDQDVLNFAVILTLMKQDGVYNPSNAKNFLNKNLQSLVPEQMLRGRSHPWSSNIFRHYKEVGKNMLDGPPHINIELILKQQFLSFCRNLTVYGSAFFFGTLLVPQTKGNVVQTACHIGVNDVGIHIINSQTRVMLHSFKYSEIQCKQEANLLEVNVVQFESRTDRNFPRKLTIRTKQAGLIDRLIDKLADIHAVKDRQVEIHYGGINS